MKKLITNYAFDHTTGTITLPDYSEVELERLLLITNVTTGVMLYNFADPTLGATPSANTFDLETDTSGMTSGDTLQIWYDDPSAELAEASQIDLLNEIMHLMLAAANGITNIANMRDTINSMRVGITSGSVGITANQTVGTVTNLQQLGSYDARPVHYAQMNVAAIQSNINNVVVS